MTAWLSPGCSKQTWQSHHIPLHPHSPHGTGVRSSESRCEPGEHIRICIFCQNFRKGHHTTSFIGSKATFQLVPAVLNEGGIMQLQVVLFCVGISKNTGNEKDLSISHSCCGQMWLTIIFCCLLFF